MGRKSVPIVFKPFDRAYRHGGKRMKRGKPVFPCQEPDADPVYPCMYCTVWRVKHYCPMEI